jgi:hypothetical protein
MTKLSGQVDAVAGKTVSRAPDPWEATCSPSAETAIEIAWKTPETPEPRADLLTLAA